MKYVITNTILFCFFTLYLSPGFTQTRIIDSLKSSLAVQTDDGETVATLIGLSDAYKFYYPDSCLKYALLAHAITEKVKNSTWSFWTEVAINDAYTVLGNYPQELAYSYKAARLAQGLNDPYVTGYVYGMLSDYYHNVGEYNTSLVYYRKVVKMAEDMFPDDISIVRSNFSRIFNDMGRPDSALLYAQRAYEGVRNNTNIHLRNGNNNFEKSVITLALGNAYASNGLFDSALLYYGRSIALSVHLDINMLDDYNGIAAVYKAKENFDSAIWYSKTVMGSRIGNFYPTGLLKASTMLASTYEIKRQNDSALKYTRIAASLKDSLWNRDKMNMIRNLTENEQNKQHELSSAKLAIQHQYNIYFLLTGFVVVLVIGAFVLGSIRQKQVQKIRNNIAADLHDDIGATLTSISILSDLSSKSILPDSQASQFLQRLNQQVSATGQALDDIIRSVRVQDDSIKDMFFRMRRFAAELFDEADIHYQLLFDEKLESLKMRIEQRHDCYLIFKEAMNNISKHADASHVQVSLSKQNKNIRMHIEDDGKGICQSKPERNGLSNMEFRVAKWNGQLQLLNGRNAGTLISIIMPVKR